MSNPYFFPEKFHDDPVWIVDVGHLDSRFNVVFQDRAWIGLTYPEAVKKYEKLPCDSFGYVRMCKGETPYKMTSRGIGVHTERMMKRYR